MPCRTRSRANHAPKLGVQVNSAPKIRRNIVKPSEENRNAPISTPSTRKRILSEIHKDNEPPKKKKSMKGRPRQSPEITDVAKDEKKLDTSKKDDHSENIDEVMLKKLLDCLEPTLLPEELPCRDKEIRDIRNFIERNLRTGTSGCKYISGVPGTGKTASMRFVMQSLDKEKRKKSIDYEFVELNGMFVSDPRRIFVEFYKGLAVNKKFGLETGNKRSKTKLRISPKLATKRLENMFDMMDNKRPAIILLLDEIDALLTKRQEHLYRILEWATRPGAKLIIVAIANTLDLPERILSNRNHSRMGLDRLCFKPYSHQEIMDILLSRLIQAPESVDPDALELIARKVAAVSGDVRRAFEISRSAANMALSTLKEKKEAAEQATGNRRLSTRQLRCGRVNMAHVDQALKQMASNIKVKAIRNASIQEKLVFEALIREHKRTGLEEISFDRIWHQYKDVCRDREAIEVGMDEILGIVHSVAESRLLINVSSTRREDFTGKYRLNVNRGDIELALNENFS